MATNLKPALKTAGRKLAANLTTVLPKSVTAIPIGKNTYTPQEAAAEVQRVLALIRAVDDAKIAVGQAIKARDAALPGLESLIRSLQAFVKVMAPTNKAGHEACGIRVPKARKKLSLAEGAAKAALARATRISNGTMGKRQRQKASQAAKAITVVFGPDGQPLPTSPKKR